MPGADALPDRRAGVDMRPTADDESNAAWGEVNRLRAELAMVRENAARMQEAGDRLTAEHERLRYVLKRIGEMAGARANGADARGMAKFARLALASDETEATGA